jgi:TolB-like protein
MREALAGGRQVQFIFDRYMLDTERRELHDGATPVAVEPQVFDVLVHLVENRNRVVAKDDLIASVWGGRVVSDSTLVSRINAARRAVGDNGDEQRLIRTVPRRGVRFVGDVETRPVPDAEAPAETRWRTGVSERPTIAVLPFLNASGEPEQKYFSDGISADLITALSRLRWFHVISRNSSFACEAMDTRRIGEELGVGYLVEGSVRKSGDRVRITAHLNDVATCNQLWAERYDRRLSDVFAVQDEITEAIVAAIEPQLYAAENFRAQRKASESLDAWELVMRALSHFWRVTRDDNRAAQTLLEQAIAVEPGYAQAHAVLAVSHTFGAHMGWEDAAGAVAIAQRAGLAAVHADGEDAWAHLALATAHSYSRRLEDALAEFETALRLKSGFPLAQGCYGLVLAWAGRWREGAEAARRAMRLSPRDPFCAIYSGVAAYAEFVGRNYAESMRLAREATRRRMDFVGGYRVLVAAAGMAGEIELARAALDELRRVQPGISLAWVARELPLPDNAEVRHFLEGLRQAGLE